MKVLGLIAEYNPFHNGHLYHIQKAKEISGADYVLVVMSGDYVQRGAPAMLPKHLRARMALMAGASAVIELPVCMASGSAEYFAAGAITLLDRLHCIDAVCFGSECGDIKVLKEFAVIAAEEPDRYKKALQEALRKGQSFPRARQAALKVSLKASSAASIKACSVDTILSEPNNILGIEYIKALHKRNSPMEFYTIPRIVSGYHDEALKKDYSSASSIRKLLLYRNGTSKASAADRADTENAMWSCLKGQVPPSSFQILKEACGTRFPVCTDDFSLLLKYRLLNESTGSLARYLDMTEELASRIMKHIDDFLTFEQFASLLKAKNLTYTRISRCLLHILLGITGQDMLLYKENGRCPYARLLGFREDSAALLTLIKKHAEIPLVTKLTQIGSLSAAGMRMLTQDISASNLYESVITHKYRQPFLNEYAKQIVRI